MPDNIDKVGVMAEVAKTRERAGQRASFLYADF